MFKLLKKNKGQGLVVQYTMTFFFVVGVIVTMTHYFKRSLQARIHDATLYMAQTVHNVHDGNTYLQYEPYYASSGVDRVSDTNQYVELFPVSNTDMGIFTRQDAVVIVSDSYSNQARPGVAK